MGRGEDGVGRGGEGVVEGGMRWGGVERVWLRVGWGGAGRGG